MKKLTPKQLEALKAMDRNGVTFRMFVDGVSATWWAGEAPISYRVSKALERAGMIAYSGSKSLTPYREAWHVTESGTAILFPGTAEVAS